MDDKDLRARMEANPFAPLASSDYVARQAHAAEYTAYYLGEIARLLEALAANSGDSAASADKIASAVSGMAHIMANRR